MSYKRKVLFVLIFASFFVVVLFLITRPKKTNDPVFQTQPIDIPQRYGGVPDFVLEISPWEFNFPNEVSVLMTKTLQSFNEDEVRDVAKKFDFYEEPLISNDILEGKTYIWSNQKGNLIIYSKSRRISFTSSSTLNTINKQMTDADIVNTAQDFLNTLSLAEQNTFKFSSFTYLTTNNSGYNFYETIKDEAEVYQVNFNLQEASYPLLTLNPQHSPVSLQVLPDGSVYRVEYSNIEGFSPSQEKYPLRSFSEVKERISESVIINLDKGILNPEDVPPGKIEYIKITNADLAYLQDSIYSTTFQPVFLFSGYAKLKDTEEVDVQLYLPALK